MTERRFVANPELGVQRHSRDRSACDTIQVPVQGC